MLALSCCLTPLHPIFPSGKERGTVAKPARGGEKGEALFVGQLLQDRKLCREALTHTRMHACTHTRSLRILNCTLLFWLGTLGEWSEDLHLVQM
jgi:hypothetical protein